MDKNIRARLCGGTYFTLVLQCLKQRAKAREHYKGESDGLTDPQVLMGLIQVINPDYREPKKGVLKGKTNDFKSCKTSSGAYLPFGDIPVIDEFDRVVREEYMSARSAMAIFIDTFLEIGVNTKKEHILVKALLDLIDLDNSIDSDTDFFVGVDGEKIKKAALGDLRNICLPSFLLGVWHYVVVNRKDNSVGADTYNLWCPSNGGSQRIYRGTLGKQLDYEITILIPDRPDNLDPIDNEPILVGEEEQSQEYESAPLTPKLINQNSTYNTFNFNGPVRNFINHADKVENNYYRGENDGE